MARTTKRTTKKKESHAGEWTALGAAAVALGAVSYYFFGPGGKDHRKQAKGWMIKMKGEVVHRLENLKEVTEPIYHEIVDAVADEYTRTKLASRAEVAALAATMKRAWKPILGPTKKKTSAKKKSSKSRAAKKSA